ncbi:MAG: C39 family peptidase [Anaerolineae bacterium]|nr:C39 family peptidase [Anaerolineae bacterium]
MRQRDRRLLLLTLMGALALAGVPVAAAQDDPASAVAPPESAYLMGVAHTYQTWNNCGPATLTMALSYWGWPGDQQRAAESLKPDAEDKNVSPAEMAAFVNREVTDVRALHRYAGDLNLLKRLVAAGFPVVIETGFIPEGEDWMGHYRLVVGYRDAEASFFTFDSYQGAGIPLPFGEADALWQHFNRAYVVAYPPAREAELSDLLGDDWDADRNAQRARAAAQSEVEADPGNPFAWFNLGTSHVLNRQYAEAAAAYDEAFAIGLPWRMLWYQFGPFEAYLHTDRLDDVLAHARPVREHTPYVEEMHYYEGMVYLARGERDAARYLFRKALRYNANFAPARSALRMASAMP